MIEPYVPLESPNNPAAAAADAYSLISNKSTQIVQKQEKATQTDLFSLFSPV